MCRGVRWTYGRPPGPVIMFRKALTHCIVTHPGSVYLRQLYLQLSCRCVALSKFTQTYKSVFHWCRGPGPTLSSSAIMCKGFLVPLDHPCNRCVRYAEPSTKCPVHVSFGEE